MRYIFALLLLTKVSAWADNSNHKVRENIKIAPSYVTAEAEAPADSKQKQPVREPGGGKSKREDAKSE